MIINFHDRDQDFIKTNVPVPNEFKNTFSDLIKYVGEVNKDCDTSSSNTLFCKLNMQGLIRREVKDDKLAILLAEMFNAVKLDIQKAYELGKADGKNILLSLNNGDISMKDFSE